MTVELNPETERLVQEEIRLGHFRSVDELVVQGVIAWREKALRENSDAIPKAVPTPTRRKTLYHLLTAPPFAGSELNLERLKDYPRPVDL